MAAPCTVTAEKTLDTVQDVNLDKSREKVEIRHCDVRLM